MNFNLLFLSKIRIKAYCKLCKQINSIMAKMDEEQLYINFDEYIKASEPHKRERAEAWRVAIGLQAVDGLQVSEYLKQTARQHIEGEITIDEAREQIKQYYISKTQCHLLVFFMVANIWADAEVAH